MRIRKKMQVRIERKTMLALSRYDDDQRATTHTTQLCDGRPNIEYVFKHVSADYGVETIIGERQLFDRRLPEIDAVVLLPGVFVDVDVNAGV